MRGMKLFMTYKLCSLCVTCQKTAVKTGSLLAAPILEAREFGLNILLAAAQTNESGQPKGSRMDEIKKIGERETEEFGAGQGILLVSFVVTAHLLNLLADLKLRSDLIITLTKVF